MVHVARQDTGAELSIIPLLEDGVRGPGVGRGVPSGLACMVHQAMGIYFIIELVGMCRREAAFGNSHTRPGGYYDAFNYYILFHIALISGTEKYNFVVTYVCVYCLCVSVCLSLSVHSYLYIYLFISENPVKDMTGGADVCVRDDRLHVTSRVTS